MGIKQYGTLLSSASRDSVGDDLIGSAVYETPFDAAEYGARVVSAQSGIKYTVVVREDGRSWVELGTGRSIADVLDGFLGPMHYRLDALAGVKAVA